jgi:hypothetical protein
VSKKAEGLLVVTDTSVIEIEDVQAAIAEGREHGFLTAGAFASVVEEADLSNEQAHDLLSYLEEHGIDVDRNERERRHTRRYRGRRRAGRARGRSTGRRRGRRRNRD